MDRLRGNPWAVLVTLSLGFFMTLLDLTVVNIAVPDVMRSLRTGLDQVLWTVSGYALVLAVLLVTAARLGDLWGQRTLFAAGVAVFTLASAGCGLAAGGAALIAARLVQGLGAALLTPQTMAMIVAVFPADRRGTALGIWGAVAGVATLAGPTLGGLLVSGPGWRWVFFVNVPVGVLVLALTFALVPDLRTGRAHRFDLPGVLVSAAALAAVTFALMEGDRYGWAWWIQALGAAGIALGALFWRMQARRQDAEPLVPFALFRDRGFTVMTALMGVLGAALIAAVVPLVFYLQDRLGLSAVRAGLALAPSPLVSLLVSPLAGRLSDRIGGRRVLLAGLASYVLGLALAIVLATPHGHAAAFVPALVLMGLGTGCMIAPLSTEAMRRVPPHLAGAAAGVSNTVRQLGSVLGTAATTALMAAGTSPLAGIHLAMALPVALLAAAALALALTRPRAAVASAPGVPAAR
ncbi:DHA2 family efflux MFS transporter permease subunit [Actinomadura parmotrematis]|uniref:DHA2 family efflux MFS transporter permease subunit n=1 Tax=Actinomadura parmotrematis TaxID=2864039 RepID=A0ABS7G3X2_9ACTN|nr:DHA2 family efflux MFS transporter permease subunit [Actinomadura parmotrematis]MBW8487409.1 DHA2 family efflux MFS transporter permease subunit [Actinomadura parmotrematis]